MFVMRREAKEIAKKRIAELEAMDWDDALRFDDGDELITAPSGTQYRVRTDVFWDMDPWASSLLLQAKVYATQGNWLRKRLRLARGWSEKPGEELPPDWAKRARRAKE